jgi:hypothetical protein
MNCEPIHIISLGAGVQSSTMALMAAAGEITPMPAAAIFADTQAEPESVYKWLDWLEKQLPFPVCRVSRGSLIDDSLLVRTSKSGNKYTKHAIPAFITERIKEPHCKQCGLIPQSGGFCECGCSEIVFVEKIKTGMAMRQCTSDHKITVIHRELNRIREKSKVIQWIGISLDEASRMKPARVKWLKHRWPLIDLNITRSDCIAWMKSHGFKEPPKSACSFCPYHDDSEWLRLKSKEPKAFAQAVKYEKDFQATMKSLPSFRGVPFLHRSLKPLDEVVFKPTEKRKMFQTNLNFVNECEGMCGV